MLETKRHNHLKILANFFLLVLILMSSALGPGLQAKDDEIARRLQGFDAYIQKILKDWNVPGLGVGIVAGDRLVLAKGYGYRDYGKKLPFTPSTLCPIASNTKLFTAVAAGLLVEEGKLTWDKPVRDSVPAIRFYNDQLDNIVTLRDMLSHRTGITRHDMIWYKSDFTRKELFERVKYMEPQQPLRQTFLYNNMMYTAAGYLIELLSGKTWEEFVRERIFVPLDMTSTVYSISEMQKFPEYGVPYTEKRDSFDLYQLPYYEDTAGMAPCGAIISNIGDMSRWLRALMNGGKYGDIQVLPVNVLKATLEPAMSLPNTMAETRGFWEILNTTAGMGRRTTSYRGRLLTFHGGDLDGFHSQVSFLPRERMGVIIFVIGDHCASLYNTISYNVYERLLGLDQTPWSDRLLEIRLMDKRAGKEARTKAGADRVPDTKPSHPVADYMGDYEHPAYGLLNIGLKDGHLLWSFHNIRLPLTHFHYDRFDTPDDELYGKWSVNFSTNPQGDIDKALMSLDEAEVVFTRRPPTLDPKLLGLLAGTYETPTAVKFQVVLKEGDGLYLMFAGQPEQKLIPIKGLQFRLKQFSDLVFEFVMENGQVKALKQRDPSGEFVLPRK